MKQDSNTTLKLQTGSWEPLEEEKLESEKRDNKILRKRQVPQLTSEEKMVFRKKARSINSDAYRRD